MDQLVVGRFRNGFRTLRRLGPAAALILIALEGCSTGDDRQGVYVAPIEDGAPGWIGYPAGVPVWSPDGTRIAWGTEHGLLVKSLLSGELSVLVETQIAGRPSWSPDGGAIAFVDLAMTTLAIASADTGQVLVKLAISDENARRDPGSIPILGGPAWSPDGKRLAFSCWDGAGDELCLVDADGSDRRVVTRLEAAPSVPERGDDSAIGTALSNVGPPAWSLDGSRLAVAVYPERRGATAGVFAIDLNTGMSRRISKLLPNSEIHWTPDGVAIIFSAVTKGRSDAWRVSERSLSASNMTEGLPKGGTDPAISPDGKNMAVASDGTIIVLNESRSPLRIDGIGLRAANPTWSPTGSEVAYAGVGNPIQSYD